MKVGNVVRFRKTGKVGLIVDKIRRCVPDGNPNGDFVIEYRYKVSCGEELITIPHGTIWNIAEVISESR